MDEQRETGNKKRTQKDYSLSFKIQVIDEVERGDYTYKEAQRKYGIQGRSTVLVWLRKHGRLNWDKAICMGDKKTPQRKIKELEKKIQRLEQEKEVLNRAIDIADDTLGADIRKKYLPLLSEASKQQQGKKD